MRLRPVNLEMVLTRLKFRSELDLTGSVDGADPEAEFGDDRGLLKATVLVDGFLCDC